MFRACSVRLAALCAAAALFALPRFAFAQADETDPQIQADKIVEFKNIGGKSLNLHLHFPEGWKATDKRPGIVFFFGGGWNNGDPKQFAFQADYFADRGMVTARADYRVKSRDGVTPDACVEDARSAVRWLRAHAGKLGLDPARLVAAGGSAGGHLAATTAIPSSVEAEGDDLAISTIPCAMLLYNPVVDFSEPEISERLGDKAALAEKISPLHHVTTATPPAILFYGTDDRLKVHGERYKKQAVKVGVRVDEYFAEGMGHGFFNKSPWLERTTIAADRFLASLGLVEGEPTLEAPPEEPSAETPPREAIPTQSDDRTGRRDTQEDLDLVYAKLEGKDLLLDIRRPADAAGPLPLVVWIHGGGWRNGSKADGGAARRLVDRGYATASINYRLSGEAIFPAQIQDCKAAIRWLRANASQYGIDPERIGVWGSSAGGHLVALLGTSGGVAEFDVGEHLDQSSAVQAVCDWFGPTDLLVMDDFPGGMKHNAPDSPESRLLGGPLQEMKDLARQASPITYIDANDPPFLIVHGDNDMAVPVNQSEILHAALQEAGVPSRLYVVKGGGHGFKGATEDTPDSLFDMAAAFFDRTLKGQMQQTRTRPTQPERPSRSGAGAAMFGRLDANSDGFLSKDEVPQRVNEQMFQRLDTNDDGKLSREEAAAMRGRRPSGQADGTGI